MILLNDFKKQWDDVGESATKVFAQVGASGWYILGKEVSAFEEVFAHWFALPHAVGVASGLDALEIALKATGCGSGDRVLTTPVSAFATTLAIIKTGAVPVFVDVDEYGLIDLDQVEKLLSSDKGIRFLVPVHLFGHACDLERFAHLEERFGITIIEDCAQSIGAEWKGRRVGSVGAIACTSFYPTKNLGAFGDGGAVITRSEDLNRLALCLRDYGQSSKYKHDLIGWNSRLDEVHAAYLSQVALPRLPEWTKRRRDVSARYLSGIRHNSVQCVGQPVGSNSCWHLFPVLVDPAEKQKFRDYLHSKGVQTGEHYPMSITDQHALVSVKAEVPRELSRAKKFCASEVSLPIHPYLTDAEIDNVIQAVNGWQA